MKLGKIRIYKLRQHNRWVASRGNIIVMAHSWVAVIWQLRLLNNLGRL